MEALAEQLEVLPERLFDHLQITVLALFLGLSISLPLGVLAVRHKKLRYPALTVVSVIQTIPSLALLALMVPLFVGIGALTTRWLGFEVGALGFAPTLVALTLYSMLPMLRNTVTGLLDVDPAVTEAARAVGMTAGQSLWRVELPLALPVIIAGIRTATVWTVGIATLATPVGQPCLGDYIFAGLHTRNWTSVFVGCSAAILLAIGLDLLIGGLQKAADERRPRLVWTTGGVLLAVFVAGLIGPWAMNWMTSAKAMDVVKSESANPRAAAISRPIIVGSKTFTEQYILAELIRLELEEAGFETESLDSLGSNIIFSGLADGELDVYVDYTGTIWANYMKQEGSAPGWKVLHMVEGWLAREHGIRSLGSLGFENAYALAIRRDRAEELGIRSIADLAPHAAKLKIGGDYEFFNRPEWNAVEGSYGIAFSDRLTFDSSLMYEAIETGKVDVISAFSSDGRIAEYGLLVLDDPKEALPPYDAVILLSPQVADHPGVAEALENLTGAIDVETMRKVNYMVDREQDKLTVKQAAERLRQALAVDAKTRR